MPNDFRKKEPTKNEKVMYELFMRQQHMENRIASMNNFMLAFARAQIDYKVLAKFIVDEIGNESFAKNINQSIGIEVEKQQKEAKKIAEQVNGTGEGKEANATEVVGEQGNA